MKKTITLISSLLIFFCINSYGQTYKKGSKSVNLGVGLIYGGLGLSGSGELAIADDISVGIAAGFGRASYGILGYGGSYNYLLAGGRGSYHLGTVLKSAGVSVDKFDPYIGITGGIYKGFYSGEYSGFSGRGSVFYGGHAGLRYQYKEKLALFAEGGYPFTSVGVSFKL